MDGAVHVTITQLLPVSPTLAAVIAWVVDPNQDRAFHHNISIST